MKTYFRYIEHNHLSRTGLFSLSLSSPRLLLGSRSPAISGSTDLLGVLLLVGGPISLEPFLSLEWLSLSRLSLTSLSRLLLSLLSLSLDLSLLALLLSLLSLSLLFSLPLLLISPSSTPSIPFSFSFLDELAVASASSPFLPLTCYKYVRMGK